MRDLGTFRGTNNPRPLDFYPCLARDLCFAVIGLCALAGIIFFIIIGHGAQLGPLNV